MRIVFGVLSLLIVVAIVGVLAKKQLGAVSPSATATPATTQGVAVPTGTPKEQVDQVKQSVENALQQSRPVNDETK
jgi:Na+-transporting methylmalonyl-CoA/oxaloacetate decarboxylase gamma subunit